jgi:hypothetical protein
MLQLFNTDLLLLAGGRSLAVSVSLEGGVRFGLDFISYAIPNAIVARRAILDLQLAPARKKT